MFLEHFPSKVLIIFIFCSASLAAQEKVDIRFDRIGKDKGLSNNNITAICKDHLGFIWVGTSYGLCRIETENRIKVFTMSDENSLKSNSIRSLLSDSNENLWIGTRLGGLTRYNQKSGEWKTFLPDLNDPNSISNNEILSLMEDEQGRIWIGTENGLNLFRPETEDFIPFLPNVLEKNALQGKAILCIEEDSENRIWLGTWGAGMYLIMPPASGDMTKTKFRRFNPENEIKQSHNVWQIHQDEEDRFWVGTCGRGMYLMQLPSNASSEIDHQEWKPTFHSILNDEKNNNSLSQNFVTDFALDNEGKLWISTGNGLNYIDEENLPDPKIYNRVTTTIPEMTFTKQLNSIDNSYSLPQNSTIAIQKDNQGILWIGTQGGLARHNPNLSKFDNYKIKGVSAVRTNSQNIYVDSDRMAWVALEQDGIIRYSLENGSVKSISDFKSNRAFSLYSRDNEKLYVGTNNGFEIVNMKDLTCTRYQLPTELYETIKNYSVQSLLVDSKDRVWISTVLGLIVFYPNNEKFYVYQHDILNSQSISDNSVTQVYETKKGDIWIGTFNGLNKVESIIDYEIKFIQYKQDPENPENSIASNQISSICEANGKLYLGMGAGICSYNFETDKFNLEFSGLDQYFYTGLEVLNEESIWATTTEGILSIDLEANKITEYGRNEGLTINEFFSRSLTLDGQGYVYVGISSGILGIHADNIVVNDIAPPD